MDYWGNRELTVEDIDAKAKDWYPAQSPDDCLTDNVSQIFSILEETSYLVTESARAQIGKIILDSNDVYALILSIRDWGEREHQKPIPRGRVNVTELILSLNFATDSAATLLDRWVSMLERSYVHTNQEQALMHAYLQQRSD